MNGIMHFDFNLNKQKSGQLDQCTKTTYKLYVKWGKMMSFCFITSFKKI